MNIASNQLKGNVTVIADLPPDQVQFQNNVFFSSIVKPRVSGSELVDNDPTIRFVSGNVFSGLPATAGDTDLDGDVDITDFNTLNANFDPFGFNHTWELGSFDLDGDVDITDFNIFNENFDPLGPVAVPEPGALLLLGGILLLRWRSKWNRC